MVQNRVDAFIFDMDGTLVDSEPLTIQAVTRALSAHGIQQSDLDSRQFLGVTWRAIEAQLVERYPRVAGQGLEKRLSEYYQKAFCESSPPFVRGARQFLARARAWARTAIATSSTAPCVEALLGRLSPEERPMAWVTAEDCARSKPDPECYRLAAAKLGAQPEHCLAFEDSLAGLEAARAAGMGRVAITACAPDGEAATALADLAVHDFGELSPRFFEECVP